MENRQSSLPLENIIGENMLRHLDEWDRSVRKRYLELAECSGLRLFEDCLHLHSRLMFSMVDEDPTFPTKFSRPSTVQAVVAASAVGSFRNLRVAHKLLLEGYFSEMHNVLRMVEQWCECAVIVEAFPEAAQRIIEHGMERKYIGKYVAQLKCTNTEVGKLYKEMRTTFQILSQRAHPLQAAFNLIMTEGGKGFYVSGILSEEMFGRDAMFLAVTAKNVLVVLTRHFQEVPADWNAMFKDRAKRIVLMDATASKEASGDE